MARRRARDFRQRVNLILEQGQVGDPVSVVIDRFLVLLLLVNLFAVALESVPSIEAGYGRLFAVIEYFSLGVFTLEYIARIWSSVEHPPHQHLSPSRARFKYILSAAGLVDLVSVLPFWIAIVTPIDLRFVLVFRMVRFFKFARYSPAMRSLIDVLYRERRALFGCLVMTAGASLILASLMHLAEAEAQPEKLGTIPDAMWWAIVTIGTIGYGDVVPVTPLGKVIATIGIFTGVVFLALPVGIIATAFSEQIHRRDFIVTWGMVAKVPLFSELDASEIANIMELLRAQVAEPGEAIIREGEVAHAMYFIADGKVEVALKKRENAVLGPGQFFGEVAVLRRGRRSATAVALTRVSLLVLAAQDLHALMRRDDHIAARIQDTVKKRVGEEVLPSDSDEV
ncbi:cyclic nucleotide-gated ion channel [Pseudolabrys sp. Root1462]|uniref:cyclic nucleotide-gated ion channel n=1 Tax=Pseudolabrys sp. Root1462 TaxID=1736466 RepID=UPI0009E81172|nr:cyclic nucleotide-gated ion channel [Pseudolabrys sp. Root1462]